MTLTIEVERDVNGPWIATIAELPGVIAHGWSEAEARTRVQALAFRVLADRIEHGAAGPEPLSVSFALAA